jgi:hypothetical protein
MTHIPPFLCDQYKVQCWDYEQEWRIESFHDGVPMVKLV